MLCIMNIDAKLCNKFSILNLAIHKKNETEWPNGVYPRNAKLA